MPDDRDSRAKEQALDAGQHGTALIILLLAMVAIGSLLVAHLTEVVAENNEIKSHINADRARLLAEAQLEVAKNIVNAAPYRSSKNTALLAAIDSHPSYVPGTDVKVRRLGGEESEWYELRATASYQRITKTAQAFVRQRSPVSATQFYVEDHPLGIAGDSQGPIHSGRAILFHFPGGVHRGRITAAEGFEYEAGATSKNTHLFGRVDRRAPPSHMLEGLRVSDLAQKAARLAVLEDLVAEVTFEGKTTRVQLYEPGHTIRVERPDTDLVFDRYESVPVVFRKSVYRTEHFEAEVPIYTTVPVLVTRTRKVYRTVMVPRVKQASPSEGRRARQASELPVTSAGGVLAQRRVWVEDPAPTIEQLAKALPATGPLPDLGHWERVRPRAETSRSPALGDQDAAPTGSGSGETSPGMVEEKILDHEETYETIEFQEVQSGVEMVTRSRAVLDHSEFKTEYRKKPIYRREPYIRLEHVAMPEELVRTETVPTSGLLYFAGAVRSIGGRINGRISVATDSYAKITGSLTYVDEEGDTRMINGLDPSRPYTANPDYGGNSVLGIIARGDILYARGLPLRIEINASLTSTEGMVGLEGIELSADGRRISLRGRFGATGSWIKESIRRLGSIVSRKRPVATLLAKDHTVLAGFSQGVTSVDRNLLLEDGGNISPPFMFQCNRPTWTLSASGRTLDPIN